MLIFKINYRYSAGFYKKSFFKYLGKDASAWVLCNAKHFAMGESSGQRNLQFVVSWWYDKLQFLSHLLQWEEKGEMRCEGTAAYGSYNVFMDSHSIRR